MTTQTTEVSKWQPRGPVLFAPRDETTTPARPGVFADPVCADQLSLALNIEYTTHDSKCARVIAEDYRGIKRLASEVTVSLSDLTLQSMVMGLAATYEEAESPAESVVDEELTTIPVAGGTIALGGGSPNFNITALSIESGATVPVALVLNDDYTYDAVYGLVTFGDLTGVVQPLKASYSHANPVILAALAAGQVKRWIRFNGINAARSDKIVPFDGFNFQVSPTSAFDLLPDDLGKLELKGSLLIDTSRSSSDPRGQFFSVGRQA